MRKALIPLLFSIAAGVAIAAPKPEDAIKYRQAVYTMIGWNFSPLGDMVKGDTPWDAGEFTLRSERVAALATQLAEGFPEGSDTGARTGARAQIWSDRAGFDEKLDAFVQASAALAKAAASGDEKAGKAAFMDTARTCKACHDTYRSRG